MGKTRVTPTDLRLDARLDYMAHTLEATVLFLNSSKRASDEAIAWLGKLREILKARASGRVGELTSGRASELQETITPERTLREAGISTKRQAGYQRRMSTLLAGKSP